MLFYQVFLVYLFDIRCVKNRPLNCLLPEQVQAALLPASWVKELIVLIKSTV